MKIEDFIFPTVLENANKSGKSDMEFATRDLVYIENEDDVIIMLEDSRIFQATDYAILNKAPQWARKDFATDIWLCSGYPTYSYHSCVVYANGTINIEIVTNPYIAARPALHLHFPSNNSARIASGEKLSSFDQYVIGEAKDKAGKVYHTYEESALQYPQTKVEKKLEDVLEKKYINKDLISTGKSYTGFRLKDGSCVQNPEFRYNDTNYVRVRARPYDDESKCSDGTFPQKDGYYWVKVEPITWKIKNWNEMPSFINPKGNGRADYIDCVSEKAIISGIPFYPNINDTYCRFYQNSSIRGYLNGINVNNISENGNLKYTAPNGGDFEGHGFLDEALCFSENDTTLLKTSTKITDSITKQKTESLENE